MANGPCGLLELLSGPEDGRLCPIHNKVVTIGPVPNALVSLDYDPRMPRDGVEVKLEEEAVRVGSESHAYGKLFQIGQVWMRVLASPQEGRP